MRFQIANFRLQIELQIPPSTCNQSAINLKSAS
jgi:hypothetical protein